jgi:hypothetical protein
MSTARLPIICAEGFEALIRIEHEDILSASFYPCAKSFPFSIDKIFKPLGVEFGGSVHSKAPDLSRYHPQGEKPVCVGINVGKVH